jgi:hypothetical protein
MKLEFASFIENLPDNQKLGFSTLKSAKMSPISHLEFLERVDMDDLLDAHKEISAEDLFRAEFFEINNGFPIVCLKTNEQEIIFTRDGVIPIFPVRIKASVHSLSKNPHAWLLENENSTISMLYANKEDVRFKTSKYACFEASDGSIRLQSIVGGKAVAGIQIKSNKEHCSYELKGFELKKNSLLQLAKKMGLIDEENTLSGIHLACTLRKKASDERCLSA